MGNITSNRQRGLTRRASSGIEAGRKAARAAETESAATAKTASMSRSASGTEIGEKKYYTQFVPVEKLAKILQQKSLNEFGVGGICAEAFTKYVFPDHPDLGQRFFRLLHTSSRAQTRHIGAIAFRQQCERFLGDLDEAHILEQYVTMFSDTPESMTPDNMRAMLTACFQLAMHHYADEAHTACPLLDRTLTAVTNSCFFSRESLSPGFVCRWLDQNCPRLVPPIHRFCQHTLTTAYRTINPAEASSVAGSGITASSSSSSTLGDSADYAIGDAGPAASVISAAAAASAASALPPHLDVLHFELATPVLDNANPFDALRPPLMPVSMAWLLAGALPPLYAKPQKAPAGVVAGASNNVASAAFMAKLLSVVPSHWTLLYDSQQHGLGVNRFLHHVLGYKGPTLVLLRSDAEQVFCVASPAEWKETHLYAGDPGCAVIQVLPKFALVEQGAKLLYLNTSQRGYPKGFRAGGDPRKPLVSVDEHFEHVDFHGLTAKLQSIEVWGCGDQQQRDTQMDIKKWQLKEAERQRTVKLTAADWLDNPDRYLLELGGRPQYNNSSK